MNENKTKEKYRQTDEWRIMKYETKAAHDMVENLHDISRVEEIMHDSGACSIQVLQTAMDCLAMHMAMQESLLLRIETHIDLDTELGKKFDEASLKLEDYYQALRAARKLLV